MKFLTWMWLLFALVPCAADGAEHVPALRVHLAGTEIGYTVRVSNISSDSVAVAPIRLGGELSLYLYDPYKDQLQEAQTTVFPGPKTGHRPMRHVLAPGEFVEKNFSADEVRGYFIYLPKCYFLVALYHERDGGKRIWSPPSNPLKVCVK